MLASEKGRSVVVETLLAHDAQVDVQNVSNEDFTLRAPWGVVFSLLVTQLSEPCVQLQSFRNHNIVKYHMSGIIGAERRFYGAYDRLTKGSCRCGQLIALAQCTSGFEGQGRRIMFRNKISGNCTLTANV